MDKAQNSIKTIDFTSGKTDIRLAIISDTHGVLDERIAAEVAQCDAVLHAGDICGRHILDELTSLCEQVIAVTGNNDIASKLRPSRSSVRLEPVSENVLIELPGGNIAMEHGHLHGNSPSHDVLRGRWPSARIIVYGHTHKQLWDKEAVPWVLNPGAAGETRTQGGASCAILCVSGGDWTVKLKKFPDTNSRAA